jgi:hypothetical protein
MALFGLPLGMLVVFALLLAAVVLFVTERLPPDVTAVALLVSRASRGRRRSPASPTPRR